MIWNTDFLHDFRSHHGVRPVHHVISMKKWIRTGKLSIKNSLCPLPPLPNEHGTYKTVKTSFWPWR